MSFYSLQFFDKMSLQEYFSCQLQSSSESTLMSKDCYEKISLSEQLCDPLPALQKETLACRICWSSQTLKQNELVSPCMCSGSMKYVHESCLGEHMFKKTHGNLNHAKCQICFSKLSISSNQRKGIITSYELFKRRVKQSEVFIYIVLFLFEIICFLQQNSDELVGHWKNDGHFAKIMMIVLGILMIGGILDCFQFLFRFFTEIYVVFRVYPQKKQQNKGQPMISSIK